MTPEQREKRVAELEHETAREWLRFAITEFVLLWVPFGLFLVAYVATDAVPDAALVPAAIAAGSLCSILALYWVNWRIKPLREERERIAAVGDSP